ncbi:MAG: hypothetical protein N2654_01030 [Deltaproteobacteria bacterium]|nr:hypothetical protein [Deltaproteobacteria bacterium]
MSRLKGLLMGRILFLWLTMIISLYSEPANPQMGVGLMILTNCTINQFLLGQLEKQVTEKCKDGQSEACRNAISRFARQLMFYNFICSSPFWPGFSDFDSCRGYAWDACEYYCDEWGLPRDFCFGSCFMPAQRFCHQVYDHSEKRGW